MKFVIWSIEHEAWWRPGSMGYARTLDEAGRYTHVEAHEILQRANRVAVHECLIPVTAFGLAPSIPRNLDADRRAAQRLVEDERRSD